MHGCPLPWGYRVPVRTPARWFQRRGFLLGALAVLLGRMLAGGTASAVTCTFDPNTGTVGIGVADGETAEISRADAAITLNGTACDVATITNTDTIHVEAVGTPLEISIDLSNGDFAPGLTPDPGDSPEIEFTMNLPAGTPTLRVVGGAGDDHIAYGTGGINLNAAEDPGDADVTFTGTPAVVLEGNAGDDLLSVAGSDGTGASTLGTLEGGDGSDVHLGGTGGSTFDGGPGTDTVDYAAGTQLTFASLTTGIVNHGGGGVDELLGLENLFGSPGADAINGNAETNELRGGPGDDVVVGAGGDDTLAGGDGIDTLAFGAVEDGVQVDLRSGTSLGEGTDSLSGFENVIGTSKADTIDADHGPSLVVGGPGSDEIFGHDGTDVLQGGPGNDQLFGGKGSDALNAGPGRDQLDGGQGDDACRGGPDPDAFVFCEKIKLG